jgi:hypothetical protein
MDGNTFLDDLRSEHETPLSRLGSSKSVYALTGGEMDGDVVKAEIASELQAVADVARTWTEEAEHDVARELFGDVASFATDHADSLAAGDVAEADTDESAIAGSLADPGSDVGRAGAIAGGFLVFGKLSEQLVGFFVGDADRKGADQFREFRSEVESLRDDAAASLETLCADEDDWGAAESAAAETIESAYDWYVQTLEGMGVKPKNVC